MICVQSLRVGEDQAISHWSLREFWHSFCKPYKTIIFAQVINCMPYKKQLRHCRINLTPSHMCTSWIDDGEKLHAYWSSINSTTPCQKESSLARLLACVCLEKCFELCPHYPKISWKKCWKSFSACAVFNVYQAIFVMKVDKGLPLKLVRWAPSLWLEQLWADWCPSLMPQSIVERTQYELLCLHCYQNSICTASGLHRSCQAIDTTALIHPLLCTYLLHLQMQVPEGIITESTDHSSHTTTAGYMLHNVSWFLHFHTMGQEAQKVVAFEHTLHSVLVFTNNSEHYVHCPWIEYGQLEGWFRNT